MEFLKISRAAIITASVFAAIAPREGTIIYIGDWNKCRPVFRTIRQENERRKDESNKDRRKIRAAGSLHFPRAVSTDF